MQGSEGEILKCKKARTANESYNSADWEVAGKYTASLDAFKTNVTNILTAGNSTTEIGTDYIISPKIGGGYLFLTHENNSVEINPSGTTITSADGKTSSTIIIGAKYNNKYIFKIDTSGAAYFKGEIQATTGSFKGDISGATGTFGKVVVKDGSIELGDVTINSTGIQVVGGESSKIGGWNVGLSSLYSGLSSTTGTAIGTYIGTEGVRQNGYGSNSSCFYLTNGSGFFSGCTLWEGITVVDKFSDVKNFGSTDSINAPMYWESDYYSTYAEDGFTIVDETGDSFRAISGMDSQYLYYNTWNSYDDEWTHDKISLAQIILATRKVMQQGVTKTITVTGAYLDNNPLSSDYKLTFVNGVLISITEV